MFRAGPQPAGGTGGRAPSQVKVLCHPVRLVVLYQVHRCVLSNRNIIIPIYMLFHYVKY